MAGVPHYSKVNGVATNEFLYSMEGRDYDTKTVSSCPDVIAEDASGNQFLNKGWVMATITDGTEAGKIGPYDTGATDGRQTAANIVGILDTFCILKSNTQHVDCAAAVLWKGAVTAAKLIVDGTQGAPSGTVTNALPNIQFK